MKLLNDLHGLRIGLREREESRICQKLLFFKQILLYFSSLPLISPSIQTSPLYLVLKHAHSALIRLIVYYGLNKSNRLKSPAPF